MKGANLQPLKKKGKQKTEFKFWKKKKVIKYSNVI